MRRDHPTVGRRRVGTGGVGVRKAQCERKYYFITSLSLVVVILGHGREAPVNRGKVALLRPGVTSVGGKGSDSEWSSLRRVPFRVTTPTDPLEGSVCPPRKGLPSGSPRGSTVMTVSRSRIPSTLRPLQRGGFSVFWSEYLSVGPNQDSTVRGYVCGSQSFDLVHLSVEPSQSFTTRP